MIAGSKRRRAPWRRVTSEALALTAGLLQLFDFRADGPPEFVFDATRCRRSLVAARLFRAALAFFFLFFFFFGLDFGFDVARTVVVRDASTSGSSYAS